MAGPVVLEPVSTLSVTVPTTRKARCWATSARAGGRVARSRSVGDGVQHITVRRPRRELGITPSICAPSAWGEAVSNSNTRGMQLLPASLTDEVRAGHEPRGQFAVAQPAAARGVPTAARAVSDT